MILWMRHGESTWNAAGRLQGRTAHPPLTPRGRAQVEDAARGLVGRGVTALRTSPAVRARQSAVIVAAHLGLDPVEEPLLVERGLDEDLDSVLGRIQTLLAEPLPAGTLLVTHGDVIALAAGLLDAGPAVVPPNAAVLITRQGHGPADPGSAVPYADAVRGRGSR